MTEKLDVGVLGATGTVGERLAQLLGDHPWFRLREVGASESSVGSTLGERTAPWGEVSLPDGLAELRLRSLDGAWSSPLLLSALPSSVARPLEPALADAGHLVVSNASSHRQAPDVPLIVPEVNPDHLSLVRRQGRSGAGGLVTNPNCVVTGLVLAMAPLHRALEIEAAMVTTFQAISGAGRPGPAAGTMVDNVIPYIAGEEEKIGQEINKILGTVTGDGLRPASIRVGATCTRVPVIHGHLATVSLAFRQTASPDDVADILRGFEPPPAARGLPCSPARPIEVTEAPDRPQPRLDRDLGGGMAVTVGRIRSCPVLDVTMMVLSHNLLRGAAGAALLNAELCLAEGLLEIDAPVEPAAAP